jgi:hypothetical protein
MSKQNGLELAKDNDLQFIPDGEASVRGMTLGEIKQSAVIPFNQKEVIVARYGEYKIKDLDAQYAGEKLRTIINMTIFESGYKVENIAELIILVIKDIFSDFSYMSLGDVGLACRKGVRGNLGEYMGISVKTFYGWMSEYNQSVITAANKHLARAEKPKKMSDDEKHIIRREWLLAHIDDFEQFQASHQCRQVDYGNVFYDYLVSRVISPLSRDEKKELLNQAKENVLKNFMVENADSDRQRVRYQSIVDEVLNNAESGTQRVVVEAKKLAIPLIYEKLIQRQTNLREVISRAENWK